MEIAPKTLQTTWRQYYFCLAVTLVCIFPIPSKCYKQTAKHATHPLTTLKPGYEKDIHVWPYSFAERLCQFEPKTPEQLQNCPNKLLAKVCQTFAHRWAYHKSDGLTPKMNVSKIGDYKGRLDREDQLRSSYQWDNKDKNRYDDEHLITLPHLFQHTRQGTKKTHSGTTIRINRPHSNWSHQTTSRSRSAPDQRMRKPYLRTDESENWKSHESNPQTLKHRALVTKSGMAGKSMNRRPPLDTSAFMHNNNHKEIYEEPTHFTGALELNHNKQKPGQAKASKMRHSSDQSLLHTADTPVRPSTFGKQNLRHTVSTPELLANTQVQSHIYNEHVRRWDERKLVPDLGVRELHPQEKKAQRQASAMIVKSVFHPDAEQLQHNVKTLWNLGKAGSVIPTKAGHSVNKTWASKMVGDGIQVITESNRQHVHVGTGIDEGYEGNAYKSRITRTLRSKRFAKGYISTFTCEDKCGTALNLPCSCAPNCLVYDNCCEGFEEHCPATVEAGKTRYADFLDLDVNCITSDVLVISSCRVTNYSLPDSNSSASFITLNEFIRARIPIYDKFTELMFVNQTIYDCNKYALSEGVIWGRAKFEISGSFSENLKNGTFNLGQMTEGLAKKLISYTFSPGALDVVGCNCFHTIKQTCTSGFKNDETFRENKRKCESFTSYVSCNSIRYANYHCMKCSNLFNEAVKCFYVLKFEGERTTGGNALSMLVSLSSSDQMVIELDGPDSSKKPWLSMSCGIDGETCNVNDCPASHRLSANNTCDAPVTSKLRIEFAEKVNAKVLRNLPDFVECKLIDQTFDMPSKPHQRLTQTPYVQTVTLMSTVYFHKGIQSTTTPSKDYRVMMTILRDIVHHYFVYVDSNVQEDIFANGPISVCACVSTTVICASECQEQSTLNPDPAIKALNDSCLSVIDWTSNGSKDVYGRHIVLSLTIVLAVVTTFLCINIDDVL